MEPDQLSLLPLCELQRELGSLENGSFRSLGDQELEEKVRQVHNGFVVKAPIMNPGTLIFRAIRVCNRPINKSGISYPPASLVKTSGRLNRAGEVMFYGSFFRFASCLLECSCRPGDFFAVSGWLTLKPMMFNHLGYSTKILRAMKQQREIPQFTEPDKDSARNGLIRDWQSRIFTQRVADGREDLYRLPVALRDHALGRLVHSESNLPDKISGVIYPSVATELAEDNVAILPLEVDSKMALFEVMLVLIDSVKRVETDGGSVETQLSIITCDSAREGTRGDLIWRQKSQIVDPAKGFGTLPPPQVLAPE